MYENEIDKYRAAMTAFHSHEARETLVNPLKDFFFFYPKPYVCCSPVCTPLVSLLALFPSSLLLPLSAFRRLLRLARADSERERETEGGGKTKEDREMKKKQAHEGRK